MIKYPNHYTFRSGDEMEWAKALYDDVGWKNYSFSEFPFDEWEDIGWFRVKIKIDTSLWNVPLGIAVKQIGAIDIYLDGNLVKSFGKVGHTPQEEQPLFMQWYSLPAIITFLENGTSVDGFSEYILAIRYSSYVLDVPIASGLSPLRELKIDDFDKLILERAQFAKRVLAHQRLLIGIFISFAILHLLLFLYYRSFRPNLFFAILTAAAAVLAFTRFDSMLTVDPVEYLWNLRLFSISALVLTLSSLRFVYSLVYAERPRLFKYLVLLAAIIAIPFLFRPFLMWTFLILVDAIVLVEIIRTLVLIQFKRRELIYEGSWIALVGILPLLVTAMYQLLVELELIPTLWEVADFPMTYYSLVFLALSMSVFLSRNIARTNKNLEEQLREVKILSEKTLQHELEKARLEAENQRKSEELEKARDLQFSMLPKDIPELAAAEIAVFMKTATEVGGDYYDFEYDTDGTLTIAFGDATGHGIEAGTVVTASKSLFKSLAYLSNPVRILKQISHPLKKMGFNRMNMAMIIAKLKHNKIELALAGMPFPLVYRAKNKVVEEIDLAGMPLGSFKEYPYKSKKMKLAKNDTVLLMSDGFQELYNPEGEILNSVRAIEAFREVADASPQNVIKHLTNVATKWAGERALEDDVTFMVIKMK
jgi:serine phosphatase RsbU (regulator of sigma subunit)